MAIGIAFGLALVLAAGAFLLWWRWQSPEHNERIREKHGRLPCTVDRQIKVPVPPDVARELALAALTSMKAKVAAPTTPDHISATMPVGLRSWGQILTVGLEATPSGTTVSLESRPLAAATVVDFGRGQRNVDHLAEAIAQGVVLHQRASARLSLDE